MNTFASTDLWDRILVLATAPGRKRLAVAYTSTLDGIPMGDGDQLFTDASEHSIRSGQTDARLLSRLHHRGVEVISIPGLHAKVFLLHGVTVVGSANLSVSSRGMIEAGVITDDPAVRRDTSVWIDALVAQGTRLTPKRLEQLAEIEVVRTGGTGVKRRMPTINEAFRADDPVLDGYIFAAFSHGTELSDTTVERAVRRARLLPVGLPRANWEWFEWGEEKGLKSRIQRAYSDRPCIHFRMSTDDEGDYLRFRSMAGELSKFLHTHRIVYRGQAYRVIINHLQKPHGFRLRGQSGELCRILNAGLEANPKALRTINKSRLSLIPLDVLREVFHAGDVAAKQALEAVDA